MTGRAEGGGPNECRSLPNDGAAATGGRAARVSAATVSTAAVRESSWEWLTGRPGSGTCVYARSSPPTGDCSPRPEAATAGVPKPTPGLPARGVPPCSVLEPGLFGLWLMGGGGGGEPALDLFGF